MKQYFKTGHQIGQPAPLFAKIEPARLVELKAKYGGQQQKPTAAAPVAQYESSDQLAAAVAEQGEKVRTLKASGAEKALVKAEVELLLKLKKQLEGFANKKSADVQHETSDQLAAAVAAQGEKVRALKASGAEKSVVKAEVDVLLKLKKQLEGFASQPIAAAVAAPAVPTQTSEQLAAAIAQQGDKVRALKASGAEKFVVKAEVDVLLKLKKELEGLAIKK